MTGLISTLWSQLDIRSAGSPERLRAILVGLTIRAGSQLSQKVRRRRRAIEPFVWTLLFGGAVLSADAFQTLVGPRLGEPGFKTLSEVVIAIGGAMIGATTIVASFILFAMQVNVERLPYTLFYRFSSDGRLLRSFAAAFLLSIGLVSLAFANDPSYSAHIILAGLVALALILRLLFHAYRRSLQLVDPVSQLDMLVESTQRDIRRWSRRFDWLTPLVKAEENKTGWRRGEPELDVRRAAIMNINKGWDISVRKTIAQAIAFSRQAAERGDLEVSAAALSSVVQLNRSYIAAKGRTFQARAIMIDNPMVTDGTVNATLEELRRVRAAAISRADEPHLEQLYDTHLALIETYLEIEYPGIGRSPSHALLAAGYLERSVEAALPTTLIDTVMQGVRTLSEAAKRLIAKGHSAEAAGIAGKIGVIGVTGALKRDALPISITAMEQLAKLQLALLFAEDAHSGYAARQVRDAAFTAATAMLALPDLPIASSQSRAIAPYFSSTEFQSLRSDLTTLVNSLQELDAGSAPGETFSRNLAEWAEQLYVEVRKLLKSAVDKHSQVTLDIIFWICGISELLIAASRAPSASDHSRKELEEAAHWLFSSLTFIPRDKETAQWVEAFSFIDQLFEFAAMANGREWDEGLDAAFDLLLRWGFEAGGKLTGWDTLQNALTAAGALTLLADPSLRVRLLARVPAAVASNKAPSLEILARTAHGLRARAAAVRTREFEINAVNQVLASDIPAARAILREMADLLSPEAPDDIGAAPH